MKISDSIRKSIGLDSEKLSNQSTKKADKVDVGAVKKENVTLSSLSSQLKSLEAAAAASEAFDAEKVEAIKAAIVNGKFTVDSEKVADGLIASVQDLLSNKNAS